MASSPSDPPNEGWRIYCQPLNIYVDNGEIPSATGRLWLTIFIDPYIRLASGANLNTEPPTELPKNS